MTVPLSKEQKLTQRMQRKAESARVARLRKKEYVGGLEEQIKELTVALAAAREANKTTLAVSEATHSSVASPSEAHGGMKGRSTNADDHAGGGTASDRLEVNGTVEQYVANKRRHQEMLNEYLDCIEDILSPSAPLQVAFHATEASDAIFSHDGQEPAVSHVDEAGEQEERDSKRQRRENISVHLTRELTLELGLTPQQVDGLARLQRDFVRPDKEVVADCLRLIRQLRGRLTEHMEASQRMTDSMRHILEPSQVPKYLEWVERNQRSMNLYNTIVSA